MSKPLPQLQLECGPSHPARADGTKDGAETMSVSQTRIFIPVLLLSPDPPLLPSSFSHPLLLYSPSPSYGFSPPTSHSWNRETETSLLTVRAYSRCCGCPPPMPSRPPHLHAETHFAHTPASLCRDKTLANTYRKLRVMKS